MKKIILFVMVGISVSTYSQAQSINNYKGPKVKNHKPWSKDEHTTLVLYTSEFSLRGPLAKNRSLPRENDSILENRQIVNTQSYKKKVSGPKAKNSKPWESLDEYEWSIVHSEKAVK